MELYTVKAVAALLHVVPEQVRRWLREGKINGVKSSNKQGWCISDIELNRFVDANPKYKIRMITAPEVKPTDSYRESLKRKLDLLYKERKALDGYIENIQKLLEDWEEGS